MEKHMRIILQFLKPYKLQIIVAYAFTLTELIAELLFPLFLGIMINEGINAGRMDKIVMWGSIMLFISIIEFLKPYKLQINVSYAFNLTELISELIFPLFLGNMINEGINA